MAVNTEMVTIPVDGESFQGYFAAPEGGPHPGVIVIQEIFGLNEHIRAVTERLAGEGFACLAPDMFWRAQPGYVTGYTPENVAEAIQVRGKIDDGRAAEDIRAAMAVLAARPESTGGKPGVVGFCWGGLMTYLSAARLGTGAAAAYYGGGTVNYLGEFGNISSPIQFHLGELDDSIPMDQVEQIQKAATGNANAEVHLYPEAGHGFNCDMRESYHAPSAAQAWERTLALFREHVG